MTRRLLLATLLWLLASSAHADCASELLARANAKLDILSLVVANSVDITPTFVSYLLPLIYVESRFDPKAVSSAEAVGLMQVTKIAMTDLNLKFSIDKLIKPWYNVKVGTQFLKFLLKQNGGNWILALVAYNAGQKFADRLSSGKKIPRETSAYITNILYLREKLCD